MRDHSRNATKKVPEGGGTHHMQAEEGKVPNQNPKSTKQREEGPTTCKPKRGKVSNLNPKSAEEREEGTHHVQAG